MAVGVYDRGGVDDDVHAAEEVYDRGGVDNDVHVAEEVYDHDGAVDDVHVAEEYAPHGRAVDYNVDSQSHYIPLLMILQFFHFSSFFHYLRFQTSYSWFS